MSDQMDVIAFYLPQFHTIPENDLHWGEGFTEWTNVRNAKSLYPGHRQPRVPMNDDYYSLAEPDTMARQFQLAEEHLLGGFCFYHYWFKGKLLLERPLEMMLRSKDLNYRFCLCWANESWTNAWKAGDAPQTIVAQEYGDRRDWERHFAYLLRFFSDPNYIVEDNKPLLVIYRPELIEPLEAMLECFDELAVAAGFAGLRVAYQQVEFDDRDSREASAGRALFDLNIEYQPTYAIRDLRKSGNSFVDKAKRIVKHGLLDFEKRTHVDVVDRLQHRLAGVRHDVQRFDYDAIWQTILSRHGEQSDAVAGAFVDWDNTPRKGTRGFVIEGGTPDKFEAYLKKQIANVRENYAEQKIFLFAWNEWAEGGYLEPDEENGLAYLRALKSAVSAADTCA